MTEEKAARQGGGQHHDKTKNPVHFPLGFAPIGFGVKAIEQKEANRRVIEHDQIHAKTTVNMQQSGNQPRA